MYYFDSQLTLTLHFLKVLMQLEKVIVVEYLIVLFTVFFFLFFYFVVVFTYCVSSFLFLI